MKCSHKGLFKSGASNEFICNAIDVGGMCDDKQPLFNFLALFFCEFEANIWIMLPFIIVALFVVFKYISLTVEEYIADGITILAERWGLSDSLASVTLLAFANGAADMVTVLVSSETEGGISYNIGSLYGGGLFVSSAVIAICVFEAKKRLRLNKMIVHRILPFYIFSTLITVGFAIYGQITFYGSLLLLATYCAMVIVVVLDQAFGGNYHLPNVSNQHDSALEHSGPKDTTLDEHDIAAHRVPSYENTAIIKLNERVISNTENPAPAKNPQEAQLGKQQSNYVGIDDRY